jgi:chemotaxis response regulator CheB
MPERGVGVLVVDDDARFGEAVTALLEPEGFAVVGHARNGREGIEFAIELRPAVVTMELRRRSDEGLRRLTGELLRSLRLSELTSYRATRRTNRARGRG